MTFNANRIIGPYQVLEQLGQGGMGTVYRAYHQELDRFVAIKVLHPAHQGDQEFIGRFRREARLIAKLEHPNIVPVYDFAKIDDLPYLVMKFVEGSTLKHKLSNGTLNFNEVTQVVNSVGSALTYAHQQQVLHRDIKPSNILIGIDGTMYLADFGLARIVNAEASTFSSDAIVGTPQYISPEQVTGAQAVSEKTDIYSFGVMLYEIVVGRVPFNSNTPLSMVHDHVYTPLPSPHSLNSNVSEPVEQVLLKALAKEPHDRYENVAQMVSDFNNAWLGAQFAALGSMSIARTAFQNMPANVSQAPVAASVSVGKSEVSTSEKKKKVGWLYVGIGVILLAGMVYSYLPDLKARLIEVLLSTYAPTAMVSNQTTPIGSEETTISTGDVVLQTAGTDTSAGSSQFTNTPRPQSTNTPSPRPTNTLASNPTTQPTPQPTQQSAPTQLPLIETVVNVIDTPPLINTLLPFP